MSYTEVMKKPLVDRKGAHLFSVRLLHELGHTDGYLDHDKIRELWMAFKDNPVLYTDEIEGNLSAFLALIANPMSVWFEIFDLIDGQPKGVYILTDIYPGYEASGHFSYWDRQASGRESLAWDMMALCFERYNLNRMTAEIPEYQSGTIRTAKDLGFKVEGRKRDAVKRRGKWVNLLILGILRSELEEIRNGAAKTA